jgi:Flp pilus assembly protein TadG
MAAAPDTHTPPFRRDERGQMVVISTLLLVALLGAAALIVDGGHWLHERRAAQGVADAAALAAVRELATGGSPEAMADEYVGRNGQEAMSLQSVTVDGGKVTVVVDRTSASFLAGTLGIVDADISATSTAQASQAGGIPGALPFAFMTDSYTPGSNEAIKVEDNRGPGNRGTIRLPMEPDCQLGQGGNDLKDAIIDHEGCPADVGSTIQTETGNTWGPIKQALDARIGSNTQSIDDVFTYDASLDRYIVRDVESPRLGVVPIIENMNGSTTWPGGAKDVRVVGYLLVDFGKTPNSPYPPYTQSTKTVWVTPMRAVLPDELEALLSGEFDPSNDSPVSFRLVD